VHNALFGRRCGVTVRFSEAGVTAPGALSP
jgi:hypothetical protein